MFTERDRDDFIASILEKGLQLQDRSFPDFNTLNDAVVIRLAHITMDERRSERHSDLLYDQQAGLLTPEDRIELDKLTAEYSYLLLVHARANAEAVRRGLMPKFEP